MIALAASVANSIAIIVLAHVAWRIIQRERQLTANPRKHISFPRRRFLRRQARRTNVR